jgi:hypothetical protein
VKGVLRVLNDPKVRGWLYVGGAVVAILTAVAILFLVAFGYITGLDVQAGVAAGVLFISGLLQVLAKANVNV